MKTLKDVENYIYELKTEIRRQDDYFLSNDFLLKTQEGVQQALESAHDELTKVDSDEEMINLIKFQAAYSANAKIITVIDEMLQTLLGLKR